MSTTLKTLLTAEEFWLLPDTVMHRSLIRGEVIETMPPGGQHGITAFAFGTPLRLWAKEHHAGVVGGESGFILARNPDVVRAPDVYFVRSDRVPADGPPRAFWELAPDLAVEIVSPSETTKDVHEKVRDYLAAGTPLIWVAYESRREVVAHTPNGPIRTYRGDDLLTNPDVLPGFSCKVSNLFE